jgi:hypothetical protein
VPPRARRPLYAQFKKEVYVLWEPKVHKQDDGLVGRQRNTRTFTCDSLLVALTLTFPFLTQQLNPLTPELNLSEDKQRLVPLTA